MINKIEKVLTSPVVVSITVIAIFVSILIIGRDVVKSSATAIAEINEAEYNYYMEYEETGKKDVFEKYNEDYKPSEEAIRDITVKVYNGIELVDPIIQNYISNVNGKILSVTEVNKFLKKKHCLYKLAIPKDAKFADNLQEEVNKYVNYLDFKERMERKEKAAGK